jgi:PAS domain S-box-containing protein
MSGSRSWSAAPQSYAAALGVVAGAMVVRFALNPVLGSSLQYFLQFVAILAAARYFGFLPSLAGLALATTVPVYKAVSTGRDTTRFWVAMSVVWLFCLALMWLLDRHRRMRSQVEQTSRLADERLEELGLERTHREREERYSAQLRSIVESSEDAIISKDLTGNIQSWNRGAEQLYGYAAEEAIGKPMSLVVPPDRRHEEDNIIERVRQGAPVKHFETVRVRKDGKHIDVSLTISSIHNPRGEIVGASHIARDIGERKELEEQMRQAQKLESLGVLAGGLAHDFNNLLTGVLGNASLVQDDLDPSHPSYPRIQEIIRASERAAALVKQMLAYAGKGRFVVQRLNLSNQIEEILPLIRSSLAPGVQLELRMDPVLPVVEADPAQMQQLVMNLAVNAAEAVGQSAGRVTISTASRRADSELQVVLTVADNGCGMDEATKERIFDPFFTTKFTGRGLGLAAVLGIIRAHRGSISVESRPGEGSMFTVLLPSCASADWVESREPQADLRGHGAILVVDDEELVRNMARFSLQRYGYSVETAADGPAALEIFSARPNDFDAVLLDLTTPQTDGEEALRAVRQIRTNVPILLSSGFNEAEAVKRFGDAGIAGYVQKPYTATTLARKLKQALRPDHTRH